MSRQDQYAAHNVIAAITAELDDARASLSAALAAKEAAEAEHRRRWLKVDHFIHAGGTLTPLARLGAISVFAADALAVTPSEPQETE